jgi:hypothetical protein
MIGYRQMRREARAALEEPPTFGEWWTAVRYQLAARVRHRIGLHTFEVRGPIDDERRWLYCTWCGYGRDLR